MIIASGSLINVITGLNYPILMLHKKTGFIFVVEAGIVILNIALNFLLIPIIGIVGAAIASGVSLALQNVIFLKIAMRYEKLTFDWKYNSKFVLAGVPAVLVAASLFKLHFNAIITAIISIMVYVFLYGLFLLILRTFTEDDFEMFDAIEKKIGINLQWIRNIVKKFY